VADPTVRSAPPARALAQPWLGLIALAAVVAVSLAFIALQPWPLFRDWVSYVAVCGVPFLFVIGPVWHAEQPPAIGRLPQPARGLAFVALDLAVAVLAALVIGFAVGGGLVPPPPNAAHVAIMAVPFTFGLAVVWDGWPFRLLRRPVAAGLLLMVAAFVLSWLTYRLFANYSAFAGGPAYVAALDPRGPFDVWLVLTFVVTAMAVTLLWLQLGLWPVPPSVLSSPVARGGVLTLGVAAVTAIALGVGVGVAHLTAAAFLAQVTVPFLGEEGVGVAHLTAAAFLAQVTVPFLFGSILLLNIVEGRVPLPAAQPVRGLASAAVSAVAGLALAALYVALLPVVSGPIAFGAPGFQGEVWVASAMLGVTFPLLAVLADCFAFWPLRREPGDAAR